MRTGDIKKSSRISALNLGFQCGVVSVLIGLADLLCAEQIHLAAYSRHSAVPPFSISTGERLFP
jgi:hypothetical protein